LWGYQANCHCCNRPENKNAILRARTQREQKETVARGCVVQTERGSNRNRDRERPENREKKGRGDLWKLSMHNITSTVESPMSRSTIAMNVPVEPGAAMPV
jgi:hypothetical protein